MYSLGVPPEAIEWPFLNMGALVELPIPEKVVIIGPFETASQNIIAAERGLGKTLWGTELGNAIAAGELFGESWQADQPRPVAYVQLDMPIHSVVKRTKGRIMCAGPYHQNLNYITRWQFTHTNMVPPKLGDPAQFTAWNDALAPFDVIIFDTLKKVQPVGEGAASSSWNSAWWESSQELRTALVDEGKCLIWLHHATPDGQVKDTKAIEDDVDQVMLLTDTAKGTMAGFQMEFTKDREALGCPSINWEFDQQGWCWRSWTDSSIHLAIFDDYEGGGVTMSQLGEKYSMARQTISKIIKQQRRISLAAAEYREQ